MIYPCAYTHIHTHLPLHTITQTHIHIDTKIFILTNTHRKLTKSFEIKKIEQILQGIRLYKTHKLMITIYLDDVIIN